MATMNSPTMDRRTMGERRTSMRAHQRSAMSALDYLAMALLIIGGLNWAMVGLFDVDMVATIFGPGSPATRIASARRSPASSVWDACLRITALPAMSAGRIELTAVR